MQTRMCRYIVVVVVVVVVVVTAKYSDHMFGAVRGVCL